MEMQELKNKLESLIDNNSVIKVLTAISEVCSEKSLHLSENWQDQKLAGIWANAATKVSLTSAKIKC